MYAQQISLVIPHHVYEVKMAVRVVAGRIGKRKSELASCIRDKLKEDLAVPCEMILEICG